MKQMWLGASAAFAMLTMAQGPDARAEEPYPWCAIYTGAGASENCGFESLQQCLATLAGMPGVCNRNPAYPAKSPTAAPDESGAPKTER